MNDSKLKLIIEDEDFGTLYAADNYLINVVNIDNEKDALYVGEAMDLHLRGDNVLGRANFSKYRKVNGTRTKKKIVRGFPPKFEKNKIPVVRYKWLWTVHSGLSHFLYNGRVARYESGVESCPTGYRVGLKDNLWNTVFHGRESMHGIIHQSCLDTGHPYPVFENIFRLIDWQIMKLYSE
jgi:hypothetical protein